MAAPCCYKYPAPTELDDRDGIASFPGRSETLLSQQHTNGALPRSEGYGYCSKGGFASKVGEADE